LSNIARDLPEGVSGGLAPITSPLGEMFMFTIDSPDLSLAERRSLLDWVIRPALRTVPGVADVNSLGGYVRAFEIVPLSDALAAHGISYDLFRRSDPGQGHCPRSGGLADALWRRYRGWSRRNG